MERGGQALCPSDGLHRRRGADSRRPLRLSWRPLGCRRRGRARHALRLARRCPHQAPSAAGCPRAEAIDCWRPEQLLNGFVERRGRRRCLDAGGKDHHTKLLAVDRHKPGFAVDAHMAAINGLVDLEPQGVESCERRWSSFMYRSARRRQRTLHEQSCAAASSASRGTRSAIGRVISHRAIPTQCRTLGSAARRRRSTTRCPARKAASAACAAEIPPQ